MELLYMWIEAFKTILIDMALIHLDYEIQGWNLDCQQIVTFRELNGTRMVLPLRDVTLENAPKALNDFMSISCFLRAIRAFSFYYKDGPPLDRSYSWEYTQSINDFMNISHLLRAVGAFSFYYSSTELSQSSPNVQFNILYFNKYTVLISVRAFSIL